MRAGAGLQGHAVFRRNSSGRARLGTLAAFALLVLLLFSPQDTSATAACPSGATMNVVAHEDDDLLFLSPDLLHDIQSGRCVRTVYVTAGDADNEADYWMSRESGMKAAYAQMAGVANSWSTADAGVGGHPIPLLTLTGRPSVSLEFMRLPDGNGDGSGYGNNNFESLQKLWQGSISQIHAVNGSSTYTKSGLTSTLTTLMNSLQPDTVRTQDYVDAFGDVDHSDHIATAYFTRAAHQGYTTPHQLIGYMDYATNDLAQNVFDPDLTTKRNAFNSYLGFDEAPCGSPPNCGNNDYAGWIKRQYTVGSESGGTGGNSPPVANAGPDQSVSTGSSVTLDGSGSSDPNADPLSYQWTQTSGTPVTLSSATAQKPTFTAPAAATTLVFSLVVNDGTLNSPADTVSITVGGQNGCPCSIWEPSAVPQTAADSDTTAHELGVRFQSSTAGHVTGIRFYKGAGNTGTHVGHLWSSTGTQLASATFTNETATGWQQVNFASPVAIAANTTYVASYFAPAGHFALDRPYFTVGHDNPPLHALADGAGGGNGVYYVGDSGFPSDSFGASNYWVDVVVDDSLPGDTTPPTVSSVSPASAATGVGANTKVSAVFSETVDPASVTSSTFELHDSGGALVTAAASASGSTVKLEPSAPLAVSTTYTATLKGGTAGIKDEAGNALAADYSWSFTTATPGACPCSLWDAGATPATPATADGSALELGVRFQSDVAGFVTGIRFHKGAGNTGTHVGHLWSATGSQLAAATFSGESASGWQTVSFASPVAIAANTTYVASYFAPAGHFALDRPYFTTAYDNAPLHAPADGAGGGNGVYYAFGSGFPTGSFGAGNYWVDVTFDTTA
jgi:LmbE family N-acetylglucosaminyl deacetylase